MTSSPCRHQDGCWGFWKKSIAFQKEAADKMHMSASGHPHVSTRSRLETRRKAGRDTGGSWVLEMSFFSGCVWENLLLQLKSSCLCSFPPSLPPSLLHPREGTLLNRRMRAGSTVSILITAQTHCLVSSSEPRVSRC